MSVITRRVVHYAAQECSWQVSGELSVAAMVDAWAYAHRRRTSLITVAHVIALGTLVEPKKNRLGVRHERVSVGWKLMLAPELVPNALMRLIESQPLGFDRTNKGIDWFREFEEIHPFVDGNGRTGSILFNWLRGSLPEPIHPPNLWSDPRRTTWPGYPEPLA